MTHFTFIDENNAFNIVYNLEKKELIYNIISFMNTIILKIELSKEVFDIFFLILIKLINKNY